MAVLITIFVAVLGLLELVSGQATIPQCFGNDKSNALTNYLPADGSTWSTSVNLVTAGDATSAPLGQSCVLPCRLAYSGASSPGGIGAFALDATSGALLYSNKDRQEGYNMYNINVNCVCGAGASTPVCQATAVAAAYIPVTLPTTSSASTAAPTIPSAAVCPSVFGYEVPMGVTTTGVLSDAASAGSMPVDCKNPAFNPKTASASSVRTFDLVTAPTLGTFTFTPDGTFRYKAPNTDGALDQFDFFVRCDGAIVCRGSAYIVVSSTAGTAPPVSTLPPVTQPSTASTFAPVTTIAPVIACPNVYFMNATGSTPQLLSLVGYAGELLCARYQSFVLTSPPTLGSIVNNSISFWGAFTYQPPTTAQWDSFTFRIQCQFANDTDPTKLVPWTCDGTANIWNLPDGGTTAPPTPAPPPTAPPVIFAPSMQLNCLQTCNEGAWKATHQNPAVWDTTVSDKGDYRHVTPRFDGAPIDAMTVSYSDGALRLQSNGKIGNVAARFPTFDVIPATTPLTASNLAAYADSVPFNTTCLDNQVSYGAGEEVWWWTNLTTLEGRVGAKYRRGASYYQKFGGKHVRCDTMADPCRFAPFLSPRAQTSPATPFWYLDVRGCDTTWYGVFNKTTLMQLRSSSGARVWKRRVNDASPPGTMVLEATVYNEAIKPLSWVYPARGSLTIASTSTTLAATLTDNIAVTPVVASGPPPFQPPIAVPLLNGGGPSNSTNGSTSSNYSTTTSTATTSTTAAATTTTTGAPSTSSPSLFPWILGDVERFFYAAPSTKADLAGQQAFFMGVNLVLYPQAVNTSAVPTLAGVAVTGMAIAYPTRDTLCTGTQPFFAACSTTATAMSCASSQIVYANAATAGITPTTSGANVTAAVTSTAPATTTTTTTTTASPLVGNVTALPDCLFNRDQLFFTPSLGPAATAPCASKPFLPAGVAGLSDARCVPGTAASLPDRSINVTLRLEIAGALPSLASVSLADFFPEGSVLVALTSVDTTTSSARVDTLNVSFSAALTGMAQPVSTNASRVPSDWNATTLPYQSDVGVSACRANRGWPLADPLQTTPAYFPAMSAWLAAKNNIAIANAGQFQCQSTGSEMRVVGAQDTVLVQAAPAAIAAQDPRAVKAEFVSMMISIDRSSVGLPPLRVLLLNNTDANAPTLASSANALPWGTYASYVNFVDLGLNTTSMAGITNGSLLGTVALVPGTLCGYTLRQQPALSSCVATVDAVVRVTPLTAAAARAASYVTVRRNIVVSTALTNAVRTGALKYTTFLAIFEQQQGPVKKATGSSDQQSSYALLIALGLAGSVAALAVIAILFDDKSKSIVATRAKRIADFASNVITLGQAGKTKKEAAAAKATSGAAGAAASPAGTKPTGAAQKKVASPPGTAATATATPMTTITSNKSSSPAGSASGAADGATKKPPDAGSASPHSTTAASTTSAVAASSSSNATTSAAAAPPPSGQPEAEAKRVRNDDEE